MPGPFSMSGSSARMDERTWAAAGSRRERSIESVADNGRSGTAGSRTGLGHGRGGGGSGGEGEGIDSQLWHACAGAMVRLPEVGAKVIYFPQGHAEHAASPPEFPHTLNLSSTIPCRVLSVKFLADTETDEVYARIRLQPDPLAASPDPSLNEPLSPPLPEKTSSFAKTLTQSDANNGGGFSVPRYCAETIFPRLDYSEDPPVQIVLAKDVHGTVWKFRHIYRGTPRRHLLTTGWSNFVNQKKLVAGDAIVFLRSASGELCVGVRRSTRGMTGGGGDSSSWHFSSHPPASRWELRPPEGQYHLLLSGAEGNHPMRVGPEVPSSTTNFARNRARVTANSVVEAATLAASGQPFEVMYYPRATISEFCVRAHSVRAALQQSWSPGMRFKMAVETEDASRISWFMGTISKVQEADAIHWPNSPWKMLQVTWDEPDLLQGIVRVSPWQVELVSPMQLPPFSLPKKKVRLSQPPELQLDSQGIMGLPMAAISTNMLGHINPWHGFTDKVPAGMQGARQDPSYGMVMRDFRPNTPQPSILLDSLYKHQEPLNVADTRVSTELNVGSFPHQGLLNVPNHFQRMLAVGTPSNNGLASSSNSLSCEKGGASGSKGTPFLLFGKAIDTSQSVLSQPPQLSAGSSSDCQGHETLSDGTQSETFDKLHNFLAGHGNESKTQCEILDCSSSEVGTLDWFKERGSVLDRERALCLVDNMFNHCKVFKESDDVGRTLDLFTVNSYDELYERLALMFSVQKSKLMHRVFCEDGSGNSRPIGDEPYRDFIQRVRRLKIVSESSNESLSR